MRGRASSSVQIMTLSFRTQLMLYADTLRRIEASPDQWAQVRALLHEHKTLEKVPLGYRMAITAEGKRHIEALLDAWQNSEEQD